MKIHFQHRLRIYSLLQVSLSMCMSVHPEGIEEYLIPWISSFSQYVLVCTPWGNRGVFNSVDFLVRALLQLPAVPPALWHAWTQAHGASLGARGWWSGEEVDGWNSWHSSGHWTSCGLSLATRNPILCTAIQPPWFVSWIPWDRFL